MSIIDNIRNRGFRDILNPERWVMFIRSLFTADSREKQAWVEQIIYRQSFPECKVCLKNGSCTHCGCKSPDLFHESKMVCSGGNWVEMIPAEDWELKKKEEGFSLGIKY